MVEYRASGEQLARDIAEELRGLAPDDVSDGAFITLMIAQGGITASMAQDRTLVVGTRSQRIDYELARALVYLESVEGQDGAVYDRETLDWHAMVLEQVSATPPPAVCLCGRPAQECTDRGRMGQLIEPCERMEEASLGPSRGEG
ncbi:hypothetical protein [Streptomyces sp. NBC_01304]|uniref:hypothetical protein n=1 Tax=Streptomyces sp. NBC_01304 TaxID=2903818 RepID=UPI002E1391B5|nr:hypothetical protein OG430_47595 [Streptomyces sp. NBC_01304]